MSADLTTAIAEYQQELGVRPGTFCAYDVSVAGVADLCDDAIRAAWGVDKASLLAAWKSILLVQRRRPPTWDIADRLRNAGAAGALVPSAQIKGGINLVLWRWNDASGRTVRALDPLGGLPADPASWRC